MQRRDFIAILWRHNGVLAAWRTRKTIAERVARIAFLGPGSSSTVSSNHIDAFKQGLLENGLVVGRNLTVDFVWADGRAEKLRQLAEDLAKRNLDIIVTVGAQPVLALMAKRMPTPIVFAIVGDPIASGVVKSLARPGGSDRLPMSNADMETKRIELLKEVVPAFTRLMILHHSSILPATVAEAVAAARALASSRISSKQAILTNLRRCSSAQSGAWRRWLRLSGIFGARSSSSPPPSSPAIRLESGCLCR